MLIHMTNNTRTRLVGRLVGREISMGKRKIGPYRLAELIGVGSVGTIHCAVDTRSKTRVALKLLLPEVSQDENIASRFKREMVVLERLDHPHIIKYYGGDQHHDQLYYAMELVEGGSVKRVLQENGRLPWREAVEIGRQVASALQHAHNHGVIHRDLKPGNLFLTETGKIKLGDFGIARDTHSADLTGHGMTVGTYAYMSPEQIHGERKVTGKADLYSFGCVLYEMLTGKQPFEGDNFAQIFSQHLNKTPAPLAERGVQCPEALSNLVFKLLEKDPEQRPFNARAVQAELMRIQGGKREIKPVEREEADGRKHPEEYAEPTRVSLSHLSPASRSRDVSWTQVAILMLIVSGAICAAMIFR
jgi:serine/threonine protein kinase